MTLNDENLEEARLLDGEVMLRWKCPREVTSHVMTAQAYHEMIRCFDNAISIIEQEYPPEDDRHKLVTAMRNRWFP